MDLAHWLLIGLYVFGGCVWKFHIEPATDAAQAPQEEKQPDNGRHRLNIVG